MSTQIDINLVGGQLLGRDANQRGNNRGQQLTKEKDSRLAQEPEVAARRGANAMKGERGQLSQKRPTPAAYTSSVPTDVAIAHFTGRPNYNSSGTFAIRTSDGTEVSWSAVSLETSDAQPEQINTLPLQQSTYFNRNWLDRSTQPLMLPYGPDSAVVCWISSGIVIDDVYAKRRELTDHTETPVAGTPSWISYQSGYRLSWPLNPFYTGTSENRISHWTIWTSPATNIPQYPDIPDWANDLDSTVDVFDYSLVPFSSSYESERVVHCAFIQGASIRKIPTPAAFATKALRLVDWAQQSEGSQDTVETSSSYTVTREFNWFLTAGFGGGAVSYPPEYESFKAGGPGPFLPNDIYNHHNFTPRIEGIEGSQTIDYNNTPLYGPAYPLLTEESAIYKDVDEKNKMLGFHYGLGYSQADGNEAGHGSTTGLFTPAIYSYLNEYLPIANNNMRNYSYARQSLISSGSTPVPNDMRTVEINYESTQFKLAKSPIPSGLTVTSDLSQSYESDSKTYPLDAANGDVAIAWNWNNQEYCAAQLAALGFTPADLAPF
jgi:hypothetical protein